MLENLKSVVTTYGGKWKGVFNQDKWTVASILIPSIIAPIVGVAVGQAAISLRKKLSKRKKRRKK